MKGTERPYPKLLQAVHNYLLFFLIVSFVVTCCMLLFLSVLTQRLGIVFTEENISSAAKLTFGNVALISLLLTIVDALRRRLTLHRPVKRIVEATERMIAGDFSVRVPLIVSQPADSELNQVVACINQMAEELSGVETLRSDFIANVSHEMKTPLSVIRNYALLLTEEDLTEEKRVSYAKSIADASRRLSDMMTNILKLNRLENQQIFSSQETYSLTEQLCECCLSYEGEWEKKGITPTFDLLEDVYISSDRELLSLVWNNLLSNAIKFTEAGGTISVSLTLEAGVAIVSVKDSGCGMSREVGAHIFEKFYQGDASRATQGNGLGLALVRRVIDIVEGEISVESTVGVGSTFTVRLKGASVCGENA